MVILPSDHLIREDERFSKVINAAASLAEEGHLVTIGIKPTRPETGYGYLELGEEMEAREGIPAPAGTLEDLMKAHHGFLIASPGAVGGCAA